MSNKETLETLAAAIESNTKTVAIDPTVGDPRTRAGRESRQAIAKENLEKAIADYKNLIVKSSVFIPLEGTPEAQAEFSTVSDVEGDTLSIDGAALYKRLAEEVYPTLGKRDPAYSSTQEARLQIALKEVGHELRIDSMVQPVVSSGAAVTSKEVLVSLIREAVRRAMGEELNKLYILKTLTELALELRYNKGVVPVVLLNLTKGEIEALQGEKKASNEAAWNVMPVKVPENVTPEQVVKSLLAVRNRLKRK